MDKFDLMMMEEIFKRKKDKSPYEDVMKKVLDLTLSPTEARKELKGIENWLNFKNENEELDKISNNKQDDEVVKIKQREYSPRVYKNENKIKMAILSGDKHFCYEDKDAIDILEQICGDYSEFIDEFIDGGDGINNDALSRFVSTEENKFNLYDEMKAFEDHMWKMKNILPKAKFVIVEDNHYHLRKKKFLSENPAMKGLFKDINFPFDVQMPHGVPYFPFEQNRVGIIHGLKTNDNFTRGHSTLFKEDIINFHTHGSQHYTCKNGSKILNKQAQKMWGMPSMCKQMDYMNGSPSRSNTGFGVLWYDLENSLYDLHYVFIENGKAVYNGKLYESRI